MLHFTRSLVVLEKCRNTGDAETGTESVSPHEMADWLMDCVLWTTAGKTVDTTAAE